MAIAERKPELGRRFYDRVLAHTINRLAGYLDAKVKEKHLAIGNTQLAAAQFMMMCQATLFQPYIFQAKPPPNATQIEAVVTSAIHLFLSGYRTQSKDNS
jgi:hypothetical protein